MNIQSRAIQTNSHALFRKSHINTHRLCERSQQNALYVYPIIVARANRTDVTRNGCLVSQEPVFIAFHLVSTGPSDPVIVFPRSAVPFKYKHRDSYNEKQINTFFLFEIVLVTLQHCTAHTHSAKAVQINGRG